MKNPKRGKRNKQGSKRQKRRFWRTSEEITHYWGKERSTKRKEACLMSLFASRKKKARTTFIQRGRRQALPQVPNSQLICEKVEDLVMSIYYSVHNLQTMQIQKRNEGYRAIASYFPDPADADMVPKSHEIQNKAKAQEEEETGQNAESNLPAETHSSFLTLNPCPWPPSPTARAQ